MRPHPALPPLSPGTTPEDATAGVSTGAHGAGNEGGSSGRTGRSGHSVMKQSSMYTNGSWLTTACRTPAHSCTPLKLLAYRRGRQWRRHAW
jgi:hypothetical protein